MSFGVSGIICDCISDNVLLIIFLILSDIISDIRSNFNMSLIHDTLFYLWCSDIKCWPKINQYIYVPENHYFSFNFDCLDPLSYERKQFKHITIDDQDHDKMHIYMITTMTVSINIWSRPWPYLSRIYFLLLTSCQNCLLVEIRNTMNKQYGQHLQEQKAEITVESLRVV